MVEREKNKKEDRLKILAAGDLHGSSDIAEKLAQKATKENVDLVLLLGDIHSGMQGSKGMIGPFKKAGKKVIFIPGNWDTTEEADSLSSKYDIKNIHERYVTYKDVGIAGVGNPDFQMELNEERTMKKLKESFDKMGNKHRKRVLISHLHAAGTQSEFSGIRGSRALRKAIDYFEPDFVLQAHIHEAEGIEEKIGKTKVINVGRKGRILEI